MAKNIEQQYQELDEISHVLQRHEMYIGTKSLKTTEEFIIDEQTGKFTHREVEASPALIKIIDEIISNSIDEHRRNIKVVSELKPRQRKNVNVLNKIWVSVAPDGRCSVTDNGGITTQMHPVSKTYVPVMIFGRLRAGSNFDDTESRDTVGKNGVGSVLTNIYSNKFKVTTADGENKLTHEWSSNMRNQSDTHIEPSNQRMTKIQFDIDLSQFPYDEIPYGVMALIERKCIMGAAAHPGLAISFNGTVYKFKTFSEYMKLYDFDEMYNYSCKGWPYDVTIGVNGDAYSSGIVNGAECNSGTHIDYVRWHVSTHLMNFMKKKHNIEVPRGRYTKRMSIFVNTKVVNPIYEGQTKSELTTPAKLFDGLDNNTCPIFITNKFLHQMVESTIVTDIIEEAKIEQERNERAEVTRRNKELKQKRVTAIRKLVDAQASARSRQKCSLWLFEGQSAGAYFRATRNPQTDAAYYLKGKSMNTVGMKTVAISRNEELADIAKAIGLQFTDDDQVIDKLRYGKIVISTDADVDGHAIACQLIATFGLHWKQVIDAGLLYRVRTPIVKAKKKKDIKYFYTLEDFKAAKLKGYDIKYLKGLGSMQKEDFREMLKNPRLERYAPITEEDVKTIRAWMGGDASKRKAFIANV